MKRIALYAASLAILLALSSAAANADSLQYTITGPAGYTASWTLSQNPTVTTFVPDAGPPNANGIQGFFQTQVTDFSVNGSTPGNQHLDFFLDDQGGGMLSDPNFDTLNFYSLQLFSGPLNSPTMLTSGSTPFSLDIGDDSFAYSLTVGSVVSTPEPSAFLLLGLGLAALFVMRRRRATS